MSPREHLAIARRELVESARKAMRARIDDPNLRIEQIASDVYCSKRHLQRSFQERSTTFTSELTQLRVRVAQTMMLDAPDLPIETVANAAGYQSAGHFAKVFRTNTGMLPKEWRASMREAGN